jgi:hypothetical protein
VSSTGIGSEPGRSTPSPTTPLRVLCVVGSPPQLNELLDAVEALKQSVAVHCSVEFDDGFQPSPAQQDLLRNRGHVFNAPPPVNLPTTASPKSDLRIALRRLLKPLPAPLVNWGIEAFRLIAYAQAAALPYWYRRYRGHLLASRQRLAELRPGVVLLAVDAAMYGTGAWIRAAREARIPSVLIPFAMADRHTLASERHPIPAYRVAGPTSRCLAARYPQWTHMFEGRKLVLLPAAQALGKQLAGTVEADPWTYNDSRADITLLESQHALEQLESDGAHSSRRIVTGRLAHDRLALARPGLIERRTALQQAHGLDPDLPLVVASVTPDKFAVYGAQTEFSSYREMLEFWVETMTGSRGCTVLASVHPSQPVETLGFLERPGFAISRQPLAEILPLAELFVVDCSATSRLAAASGIPVLDYDLYGFDLKFNQVGKGLVHVRSRAQFSAVWRDLWQKPDQLLELKAAQVSNASEFGVLDGGAGRRIAGAIIALCSKSEVDRIR